MAIVPHRTSLLINFSSQTAGVSRLSAAVARFRPQSSDRIAIVILHFLLRRGILPRLLPVALSISGSLWMPDLRVRPALTALRRNLHGMVPNGALLEQALEETS